jgi:ribosomal protein S18 acetylase RimI-like enzyme
MTEVLIRKAIDRDLTAILRLWHEMMELHAEIEPMAWTIARDADSQMRSYLKECAEGEDHLLLVAEKGVEVIGYLLAARAPRPPVLDPPICGAISDCAVTRSSRRQGVGTRLVAEAMRWFQEQGLAHVQVSHATRNPLSSAFWHAQGFRAYQATCIRALEA